MMAMMMVEIIIQDAFVNDCDANHCDDNDAYDVGCDHDDFNVFIC